MSDCYHRRQEVRKAFLGYSATNQQTRILSPGFVPGDLVTVHAAEKAMGERIGARAKLLSFPAGHARLFAAQDRETIAQELGIKLVETVDALTPILPAEVTTRDITGTTNGGSRFAIRVKTT